MALVLFMNRRDQPGWSWPSYRELVAVTGMSRPTIQRGIEQLENECLLVVSRPLDGKKRTRSEYRLLTGAEREVLLNLDETTVVSSDDTTVVSPDDTTPWFHQGDTTKTL